MVTKHRTVKVVRKPRLGFPVDVPVNVKVQGQRTMLKNVRLVPGDEPQIVRVLTGRRGRPMHLPVEQIEKVRAL